MGAVNLCIFEYYLFQKTDHLSLFKNYEECQKHVIINLEAGTFPYSYSVPENYFYDLVLLQELNLKENQIREIPVELFQNNVELTILNLGNNRIKSLESNTFKSLTKLDQLQLFNNDIQHFSDDLFRNNPLTWSLWSSGDKGSKEANIDYWIYRGN